LREGLSIKVAFALAKSKLFSFLKIFIGTQQTKDPIPMPSVKMHGRNS